MSVLFIFLYYIGIENEAKKWFNIYRGESTINRTYIGGANMKKINAIVFCQNNEHGKMEFYLRINNEYKMYLFTTKYY